MKPQPEYQTRHEKLIDFLSQLSQYSSEDGKPLLKKIKDVRTVDKVEKIPRGDINVAVVVFTDTLNIYSGSAGNVDLYRLLQAYLTIPEYRDKINSLVDEAHSFDYNTKK